MTNLVTAQSHRSHNTSLTNHACTTSSPYDITVYSPVHTYTTHKETVWRLVIRTEPRDSNRDVIQEDSEGVAVSTAYTECRQKDSRVRQRISETPS